MSIINNNLKLQSFLSKAGVSSRRKCEDFIIENRVIVNGKVVNQLGARVDPKNDIILLDGKRVNIETNEVYVIINKPSGYLVSTKDNENKGRYLAIELIQPLFKERLFAIGRLDYLSKGLLIFSNDGYLSQAVSHPKYRVEKEYVITTQKPISKESLEMYKQGLVLTDLDGIKTKYTLKDYNLIDDRNVSLVLEEGQNREIRKVFAYFKYTIRHLKRVRIGKLKLGDLPEAHYKVYSKKDIYKLLGVDLLDETKNTNRKKVFEEQKVDSWDNRDSWQSKLKNNS